ncbi:hypothetical protein HPB50_026526 [Hyalomma asiaticum]|uniref:Uncharacterized protein n=1 Tax=Hyalomma asiaticum TaxID=266040 RepID=A0ACB7SC56_HYAAI|nr:hypothetical protein HPB50_026526 [Hyalomma asiaticum]
MKNQKASDLDDIPNEFLKSLRTNAREVLLNCFNDILTTRDVPEAWKETRIRLIHKAKGKSEKDINAYRPIAVLSNVLKLLNTILNRRLQNNCERNNILSESQNGFRPHRRTSDYIFTLTEAIEMKHKQKSQLYLAFLDLEKAYDSIPHAKLSKLWRKLEDVPLEDEFIELLKELYTDCTAVYELHGHKSEKVNLKAGLKQGCPFITNAI